MSFLGSSALEIRNDAKKAITQAVKKSSITAKNAANAAAQIRALGSSDYAGTSNAINIAKQNGLVGTANLVGEKAGSLLNDVLYGSSAASGSPGVHSLLDLRSGSSGSSGYSYSGSATGGAAAASKQEKTLEQIINETVDKNNAWAAEQAQKQMDFQKMMSDTAHQREVADLKAAGLNPVLSVSGGSGASMASGAMAQPDTSNTRLLAEMSLAQTQALGNSAVQLASSYRSKASNNFASSLLNAATKYVVPTLVRGAARALSNGLFG